METFVCTNRYHKATAPIATKWPKIEILTYLNAALEMHCHQNIDLGLKRFLTHGVFSNTNSGSCLPVVRICTQKWQIIELPDLDKN